jgi:hypothetical protein
MGNENQALSVSLSADGNTTIVGGPGDNSGTGATWVFTRYLADTNARGIFPLTI